MPQTTALFPAFLKLAGRRVLVVGAGPVAASKLRALIDARASVTIVAPEISDAMRAELESCPTAEDSQVPAAQAFSPASMAEAPVAQAFRPAPAAPTIVQRTFQPSDLDDVWFVVAAAPHAVNRAVAEAAEARRLFVNAVDDPPNASMYLGGVVRRDGVTVAISTNGRAPALAGLLREGFDELLPGDLGTWMRVADGERVRWKATGVAMEERRPQLLRAINNLYEDLEAVPGARRQPPVEAASENSPAAGRQPPGGKNSQSSPAAGHEPPAGRDRPVYPER
jgi:uroporphyrin-III C-methyltransferase / precorrin-2 dehydrogenase / sirohydrochlorin ferrochelatase